MPKIDLLPRARRDLGRLAHKERARFFDRLEDLISDLSSPHRQVRNGLRFKPMKGMSDIYEMTWMSNRRATLEFGDEYRVGDPHLVIRRVGTHDVLDRP